LEWTLVTATCNLKRLFNLGAKLARAWKEAVRRSRRGTGVSSNRSSTKASHGLTRLWRC